MHRDLAEAILQAWEEGRDVSAGERGLILLRLAEPDLPESECARLTVGQRDGALIDLFQRLFGSTATALSDCPDCAEPLELDIDLPAIRIPGPTAPPARFVLDWGDGQITYRLPNAADLAALGAETGPDRVTTAARWLAYRCLLPGAEDQAAKRGDTAIAIEDAAAAALETAIDRAVAAEDPQAIVTIDFQCPACAHQWHASFDIVEFLWRRLDVFNRELLREIHALATAYSWSERDILALSNWRRRHYLGLIGA